MKTPFSSVSFSGVLCKRKYSTSCVSTSCVRQKEMVFYLPLGYAKFTENALVSVN